MIVPALGRIAKFGAIYDARKNEFVGINVFTRRINKELIDTDENPNTSYKFSYAVSESEKMDALNIQGELKLRIWCGLIKVEGSASYIKNSRSNRKSLQCNYILKTTTKKESFNWRLEELKESFDFSGIENLGTHMIIGIQYGGNGVVTLTYNAHENVDTEEIKGSLKGKFVGFPSVGGSIGASGEVKNKLEINENDLNINVEADVSIKPSDDITTVEGTKIFMKHLAGRLSEYNDGKGLQISFEMIPIKTVTDFFKLSLAKNIIYKSLQTDIIQTITHKLNDVEEIKDELNERIFELQHNKKYFTRKEIEWFAAEELRFKNIVVKIHSKIDEILQMFQDEISSANEKLIEENDRIADLKMNVGNFISNSEILLVKAFFIKSAEENGIEYVFQENQLAKLKLKNKKMYICFFTAQNYRNQYNLLRNFVNECCDDDNGRKESDMKYVMIDADILEILVKQELSSESLPRHPLYIFVNNKYQEDPKTKPATRKHSVAVGIDLGTTNSCVAVYTTNGVEILANHLGHKVTPSYVLLDGDIPIVGDEAKKAKSGQYKNRIYDAKRMLGKKFSHSSIQQGKKCWPFEVRADIHDRPLIHTENYKDKWIYPEQISAFVLERMKQIVENFHLGTKEQITDAVITVPAHFNDAEREATKHAAELAGINVLRLLSEPSAAGLAFCYHKQQFLERSVLVYDLGGGTFDVSVMKINQGHINVQAVGGDSYLGGNDFDDRLLKYCIEKFRILFKENLSTNANAVRRLRNACITAKEHLSGASTYQLEIESLFNGRDFEISIHQTDFEGICQDLFEKTMEIVEKALKDAKMAPQNIDEVLLVGGSSRIPKVQEMLIRKFGAGKINKTINADEAVAYGAAIQAAIITGEIEKQCNIVLMDVTPLSLGINVKGCNCSTSCNCPEKYSIIIPRNSKIPTKRTKTYVTSFDNQTIIGIKVLEGEYEQADSNHRLGDYEIKDIPKNGKGKECVEITFDLDANAMLAVTAKIVSTGRQASMTINYDKKRLSRNE